MGSLSRADSFETLVEQFGIKPKSKINRLKGYEKLLLIWLVARREADTVAKVSLLNGSLSAHMRI